MIEVIYDIYAFAILIAIVIRIIKIISNITKK